MIIGYLISWGAFALLKKAGLGWAASWLLSNLIWGAYVYLQ